MIAALSSAGGDEGSGKLQPLLMPCGGMVCDGQSHLRATAARLIDCCSEGHVGVCVYAIAASGTRVDLAWTFRPAPTLLIAAVDLSPALWLTSPRIPCQRCSVSRGAGRPSGTPGDLSTAGSSGSIAHGSVICCTDAGQC